jgi:hypothetical protein
MADTVGASTAGEAEAPGGLGVPAGCGRVASSSRDGGGVLFTSKLTTRFSNSTGKCWSLPIVVYMVVYIHTYALLEPRDVSRP